MTTTTTSRISAVPSGGATKRVDHQLGTPPVISTSGDPWRNAWRRAWGNSWGGRIVVTPVDDGFTTHRISGVPSGGATKRVTL